jgi:hypothetical protein
MLDEVTIPVQIIQRKNGLTLVEWSQDGTLKRAWLDQELLVHDNGMTGDAYQPWAGIPYGVEWSRMITPKVTSIDIDRELKRRGVWTIQELRTKPNEVLGALRDAYGLDLAALLQAAKVYEKDMEV